MIYLDHNATSPLRAPVRRAMEAAFGLAGNASSVHGAGRAARALVENSREKVAKLAKTVPGSVIFTSGGSESNWLALHGAIAGARAAENRITRLFVSAIEHESVRANAAAMADSIPGVKLQLVPVTAQGILDLHRFRLMLIQGKGRALTAVMAANNETGVLQDIPAVAALLRAEAGDDALLHVDAVQAAGRIDLDFMQSGASTMSLSAHKIGGPQGAGALLLNPGVPFVPPMLGGGQEMGRRPGTENVAALAGFAAAAEEASALADVADMRALAERFEAELLRLAPDAVIFGAGVKRLPNTVNFAIPDLSAEAALIALDLDGVALSSGSACSSGKVKPSHVLAAMGVDEQLARCGLRLSLGWTSCEADIDAVLASLARLLARRRALAA